MFLSDYHRCGSRSFRIVNFGESFRVCESSEIKGHATFPLAFVFSSLFSLFLLSWKLESSRRICRSKFHPPNTISRTIVKDTEKVRGEAICRHFFLFVTRRDKVPRVRTVFGLLSRITCDWCHGWTVSRKHFHFSSSKFLNIYRNSRIDITKIIN